MMIPNVHAVVWTSDDHHIVEMWLFGEGGNASGYQWRRCKDGWYCHGHTKNEGGYSKGKAYTVCLRGGYMYWYWQTVPRSKRPTLSLLQKHCKPVGHIPKVYEHILFQDASK